MKLRALHISDALRLLKDGSGHKLEVWKLSTGDLLTYRDARYIGGHVVRGLERVRLPESGLIRCFRWVSLYSIDDLKVFW